MGFWSSVGSFFKSVGSLVVKGLNAAGARGLTDQVVALALVYVRDAAKNLSNDQEKRDWVIAQLVKRGIPDSIARLATELAYQLFKSEIEKIPAPPDSAPPTVLSFPYNNV